MRVYIILLLFVALCFGSCQQDTSKKGLVIDFGKIEKVKLSDVFSDLRFVKLELSENSMIGKINQIEVFNDKIYIIDSEKTNSLYVFSQTGKLLEKIEGNDSAVGRFLSPHSFWIDKSGFLFILDIFQGKLLKYRLSDLSYLGDIILPKLDIPCSFAKIPNNDFFVYYYLQSDLFQNCQYIIADRSGNVKKQFYDTSKSGRFWHGNSCNFYEYLGKLRTYPYFSNEVYQIQNDKETLIYSLEWNNSCFPEGRLFERFKDSSELMKTLFTSKSDWIRFMSVYENSCFLAVKYYIKRDLCFSGLSKQRNHVVNLKCDDVIDDLGIGGVFPNLIGVYKDELIGSISICDVLSKKNKTDLLRKEFIDEGVESNPLLVFFKIK